MGDQRISEADRQRFRTLYPALRRFAGVVSGPGIDPDDLLQEALVRVVKRGRLAEIEHPAAYLRRTMLNLISSQRSRFRTERDALARSGGTTPASMQDPYPSDLSDLLRLPIETRAVLFLAEVEGFRYDEIAEMLGCSASTARKRASRGRRLLRTHLGLETSQ